MRKLWVAFTAVIVVSFLVLGWVGVRIYQEAPPIPATGRHHRRARWSFPAGDIEAGQNVWQSMGGHGGGLDLGARQLRRARLDRRLAAPRGDVRPRRVGARRAGGRLRRLWRPSSRRRCSARLQQTMRTQHATTRRRGVLRIDPARGRAFAANAAHYADVFAHGRDRVRDPAGRADRPGQAAAAGGLLLLDVVGGLDQPARRHDHLHQQLAARAARRQRADGRGGRVDRRQHHPAARGHRRHGLVLRGAARGAAAGAGARRAIRCSATRRRRRSARP